MNAEDACEIRFASRLAYEHGRTPSEREVLLALGCGPRSEDELGDISDVPESLARLAERGIIVQREVSLAVGPGAVSRAMRWLIV